MKYIKNKSQNEKIYGRNLFAANFVNDFDIKNKDILDIGCGFGWFELNAISRGVSNIVGIEISEQNLAIARKNIINSKIKFVVGNAINLAFKSEKFDTLISWEVLEHIPENKEELFFKEANRVLKRGGHFYLSTPNNSFFAKLFDPAFFLLRHRHYNIGVLSKIIRKNGFSIEEVDTRGGWTELLGGINLLIAKWIFKREIFFKKKFQHWQNKEFSKKGFAGLFIKLIKK